MKSSGMILSSGYKPLFISLVVTLFAYLFTCSTFTYIMIAITLFIAFVFRNSSRYIFNNNSNFLSPVDGKVEAIDKGEDFIDIYIKVSLCDSHIVRAPMNGKIVVKKYQKGLNLSANSFKANLLNEQIIFTIDNIELKLISSMCNISIEKIENKEVSQGEPLLTFTDGLVKIRISNNENISVNINDKLISGQSIIYKM